MITLLLPLTQCHLAANAKVEVERSCSDTKCLNLLQTGGTSAIKNEKTLIFSFYCIRFALSLDKIGGTSAIKSEKNFGFFFLLHSVCTIFAVRNIIII